jgi:hypothetical protein
VYAILIPITIYIKKLIILFYPVEVIALMIACVKGFPRPGCGLAFVAILSRMDACDGQEGIGMMTIFSLSLREV